MRLHLEDLTHQLDLPAVREVLALAVAPDPLRLEQTCQRYRAGPPWYLLGYQNDGGIIGCIGLTLLGDGHAVVENLAVLPAHQRRGLGRQLLADVAARFALVHLMLETDRDAVEFYRRCGFTIASLGEKYPGIERFSCTWHATQPSQ